MRKTFEIRGWRPRICKNFEIIRTIYSNSERSEQVLVTECFFNLFLEVSHIKWIGTIIIQIGKNYWDLETCRKSYKKIYPWLSLLERFPPPLSLISSFLQGSVLKQNTSLMQKIRNSCSSCFSTRFQAVLDSNRPIYVVIIKKTHNR